MSWFNYWGLIGVALILVPNILCAVLDKSAFQNAYKNKPLEICEQVGRYGCMAFSVFNIPYTFFGFWFSRALTVYLSVGGGLILLYLAGWLIFRKRKNLTRAIYLSVTPALFFAFCAVVVASVPLAACSVIFGICHIRLSCANALNAQHNKEDYEK